MEPHTSRYVTYALAVAGVVIMLIGQGVVNILVALLGLLLITAGLAVQIIFWRCPSCGRYLGRPHLGSISFCPHCGAPL